MQTRKPEIREADVRRFLGDQMAYAETLSLGTQRTAAVQRLLAKLQLLSDREFETAFRAFEALVENCESKKATEKAPAKTPGRDSALAEANKVLSQNQKKSA